MGNPEGRKKFETSGIADSARTLDVTAVVLSGSPLPRDRPTVREAILVTPRHLRKSESDADCEGCGGTRGCASSAGACLILGGGW
jgi:hypothetical protein